jgi:biotin transporter BioY
MTCGLAVIFACGVAWLAFFARASRRPQWSTAHGPLSVRSLDIFKLIVAAAITPTLWRLTRIPHP